MAQEIECGGMHERGAHRYSLGTWFVQPWKTWKTWKTWKNQVFQVFQVFQGWTNHVPKDRIAVAWFVQPWKTWKTWKTWFLNGFNRLLATS